MRVPLVQAFWFLVAVIAIGALYLGFNLLLSTAFGATIPEYSWGKWLLLIVAVGLFSAFAELVLFPRVMGPDKVTDPVWKRSLRLTVALAAVAAFCAAFLVLEAL